MGENARYKRFGKLKDKIHDDHLKGVSTYQKTVVEVYWLLTSHSRVRDGKNEQHKPKKKRLGLHHRMATRDQIEGMEIKKVIVIYVEKLGIIAGNVRIKMKTIY